MATNGNSDEKLWRALVGLDDDLLDPALPEAIVDEELRAMGVDPARLAKRGSAFVAKAKEAERLSWQTHARDRRTKLQERAAKAAASASTDLDRMGILARLNDLRDADPNVGTAIRMAARKRKPEESTDDELRALLAEMEALRAIEGNSSE